MDVILGIVVLIVAGIIMADFFNYCLSARFSEKIVHNLARVVFVLLNVLTVSMMGASKWRTILTMVVFFAWVFLFYREQVKIKIPIVGVEFILISISETIGNIIWTLGNFDEEIPLGSNEFSMARVFVTLSTVIVLWGLNTIFLFAWKRNRLNWIKENSVRISLPLITVQLCLFCFLMQVDIFLIGSKWMFMLITEVILMIIEMILMYYEFIYLRKKELLEMEIELMEANNRVQAQYCKERIKYYDDLRELRHDAKNQLQMVCFLVDSDKDEAEKILDSMEQKIQSIQVYKEEKKEF